MGPRAQARSTGSIFPPYHITHIPSYPPTYADRNGQDWSSASANEEPAPEEPSWKWRVTRGSKINKSHYSEEAEEAEEEPPDGEEAQEAEEPLEEAKEEPPDWGKAQEAEEAEEEPPDEQEEPEEAEEAEEEVPPGCWARHRLIRCQGGCGYLRNSDKRFAGFCCMRCAWEKKVDKIKKRHGPACQKVDGEMYPESQGPIWFPDFNK